MNRSIDRRSKITAIYLIVRNSHSNPPTMNLTFF